MSDNKDSDSEDDGCGNKGKSRRELPAGAVATLKAWLLSPEHFTHPYPTPQDQVMLMQKTGIDKKQLKNWFTNARRRIWKPMLKKQLEQGKLTATGAGGGGVAVPGVVPGLMISAISGAQAPGGDVSDQVHSVQAMQAQYQQAVHQQPQQYDQYGNPIFIQQVQAPAQANDQTLYAPQSYAQTQHYVSVSEDIPSSGSIGSLPGGPTLSAIQSSTINKIDSHAVLMELFARDQDLVRQATESAKMKADAKGASGTGSDVNQLSTVSQHPMKMGSQSKLMNVPTLNSWPHFSSISSLNNLGSMTGVKSITSMSGADLASQGNLNRMGNLAQVKSMESMGRNDSYAFLEVFFGDKSMTSSSTIGKDQQRGHKREREEDSDVGLSLDADESPSASTSKPVDTAQVPDPSISIPAPLPAKSQDSSGDAGTLKRAYDDALAARGLMSVSRSSEKLSDLALPAKMRKTLSQEFLRQHQAQAQVIQSQQHPEQCSLQSFSMTSPPPSVQAPSSVPGVLSSQQYPGQHPQQHQQTPHPQYGQSLQPQTASTSSASAEVHVPSTSTCARCHMTGVDTQLRPCGHMFHERCLKPSLQVPVGQPKCPIDNTPIQSALLAIPTDEARVEQQTQAKWGSQLYQPPLQATPSNSEV